MNSRPALFIASSKESLDVARALQAELLHDVECTIWSQDVFGLSQTSSRSLLKQAQSSDFGAFVFSPDDVSIMRGEVYSAVRDNVIFELGLFAGALGGIERCFMLTPIDGHHVVRLPSDLLGLTTAQYEANRQDKNARAGIGPAALRIRDAIREIGPVARSRPSEARQADSRPQPEASPRGLSDKDCSNILRGWVRTLPAPPNQLTNTVFFDKLDQQLELPSGAAKKLLKEAAEDFDYSVAVEGEKTISFNAPPMIRTSGRRRDIFSGW
ncbi:TIR domain-containing protein [Vandammella animalimorsus]|nr:nucleotide-binding protein [Vandammella animalimorsus]